MMTDSEQTDPDALSAEGSRRRSLDIRTPIGALFGALGLMLSLHGLLPNARNTGAGIRINLWWGLVMLLFGGTMLYLARRRRAGHAE